MRDIRQQPDSKPQPFYLRYWEYLIPPLLFITVYFHYSFVSWVSDVAFSPTLVFYCLTPMCVFPIVGVYFFVSIILGTLQHQNVMPKIVLAVVCLLIMAFAINAFTDISLIRERNYFSEHEATYDALVDDFSEKNCFQPDVTCQLTYELSGEAADVVPGGTVSIQKTITARLMLVYTGRANLYYVYMPAYDTPPHEVYASRTFVECIEELKPHWFLCYGTPRD